MPVSGRLTGKTGWLGGKHCRKTATYSDGVQVQPDHGGLQAQEPDEHVLDVIWESQRPGISVLSAMPLSSGDHYPWLCEDKPVTFSWNSTERSCLLSSSAAIYPRLVFVGSPTQPFPEMTVPLFLTLL